MQQACHQHPTADAADSYQLSRRERHGSGRQQLEQRSAECVKSLTCTLNVERVIAQLWSLEFWIRASEERRTWGRASELKLC